MLHPEKWLCMSELVIRKFKEISEYPNEKEHENLPRCSVRKSAVSFEVTVRGHVQRKHGTAYSDCSTLQHVEDFTPNHLNSWKLWIRFVLPLLKGWIPVIAIEYTSR